MSAKETCKNLHDAVQSILDLLDLLLSWRQNLLFDEIICKVDLMLTIFSWSIIQTLKFDCGKSTFHLSKNFSLTRGEIVEVYYSDLTIRHFISKPISP
jgi:hypothetical protein